MCNNLFKLIVVLKEMSKNKEIILLISLILLFFIANYSWMDNYVGRIFENINREDFTVKRVIDGDTIVVGNDTHVRLFGINTPEKGEKYYKEAKEFVNKSLYNKTIFIESFGKDKYYRELGIVFFEEENFNAKMIELGFANAYILDDKQYENVFREAWEKCVSSGKNLCEKSKDKCADCVELKELDIDTQKVSLNNKCSFDCDLTGWEIKDEGRKKFTFNKFILGKNKEMSVIIGNKTDTNNVLYWEGEDYVWTSTGDTLFLRDDEGKLVIWREIGMD